MQFLLKEHFQLLPIPRPSAVALGVSSLSITAPLLKKGVTDRYGQTEHKVENMELMIYRI